MLRGRHPAVTERAGPGATLRGRVQEPRDRRIARQGADDRALPGRRLPRPRLLRSCPRPPREPRQGQVRGRRRPRLRPRVRHLRRSPQAGRRDHQGRQGRRHGLPRHRPRPRGRGDRLARRRGGQRARVEDPAGDLQRDHRERDPRGVRPSARDRHEPRRRPADAADRRPPRRLHAQPAARPQGPRRACRPAASSRSPSGSSSSASARSTRSPPASTGRSRRSSRPRPATTFAAELVRIDGAALDVGDGETAERHAAALREPAAARDEGRDPQAEAQPGAAVHDLDAPAGGEPQARLQPEADDVGRPAAVRGRRHAGRPRRPDHLHANRLDRDRRRGDGRGPRRHPRPVRRAVHDAQGPGLQDEGEGRPGGPRVDPADVASGATRTRSPGTLAATSSACTA